MVTPKNIDYSVRVIPIIEETNSNRVPGSALNQNRHVQSVFVSRSYHQKYLLQRHPWLLQALDIDPEDLVESHVAARLNGFVGGYGKAAAFDAEWERLGLNSKMAEYVKKEMVKNKR